MNFTVHFRPGAARQFAKLTRNIQLELTPIIDQLAETQIPPAAKKLSAKDNLYRVRHGRYRIVYQLQNNQLIVLIVAVGHRRDVYRGL
ncbi:type II toxin-antitoxin system RelE family toxin [Desulfonatronum thiodismutans]|uniref:type II toxin-antitoxin system RelE family toxin n=1 Tax=Desulfonatronum thiodismutans TaxID=159290 RepID=UPI000A04A31A